MTLRNASFSSIFFVAIAILGLSPGIRRRFRLSHGGFDPQRQAYHGTDVQSLHGSSRRITGVVDGIEGCVGNTPLIRIKSLSEETGCEILAKAEFLNGGGGSPKDRVALKIIHSIEDQGLICPGDTVYEGTVGSTGISLATICRAKGLLAHICMPSDQAQEKADHLRKLGAIVECVPPASIVDPMHFVNRARSLAAAHTADPDKPGRGFFADQFETDLNWKAHYETTGPEIYEQCEGKLDAFVAGAGTGGTIAGVSRFLKPKLPHLRIVLADPQGSGLFNRVRFGVMFNPAEKEGTRRRHQVDSIVEGIGLNRVTTNFQAGSEFIDDAVKVSDEQATAMARWLVEKDGIFIGSSSAVNCSLSIFLWRKPLMMRRYCCYQARPANGTWASYSHDSVRLRHKAPLKILGSSRRSRR